MRQIIRNQNHTLLGFYKASFPLTNTITSSIVALNTATYMILQTYYTQTQTHTLHILWPHRQLHRYQQWHHHHHHLRLINHHQILTPANQDRWLVSHEITGIWSSASGRSDEAQLRRSRRHDSPACSNRWLDLGPTSSPLTVPSLPELSSPSFRFFSPFLLLLGMMRRQIPSCI